MKRSTRHTHNLAALIAAAMLLALTACGSQNNGQNGADDASNSVQDSTSITVTDMMGRVITLEEPATRVVALTDSD